MGRERQKPKARPGARPMEREWVVSLRDQCRAARVPFFFKQWGGVQKKKRGRELDGRVYSAFPRRAPRLARGLDLA